MEKRGWNILSDSITLITKDSHCLKLHYQWKNIQRCISRLKWRHMSIKTFQITVNSTMLSTFRITNPLRGESTSDWWIALTKSQ